MNTSHIVPSAPPPEEEEGAGEQPSCEQSRCGQLREAHRFQREVDLELAYVNAAAIRAELISAIHNLCESHGYPIMNLDELDNATLRDMAQELIDRITYAGIHRALNHMNALQSIAHRRPYILLYCVLLGVAFIGIAITALLRQNNIILMCLSGPFLAYIWYMYILSNVVRADLTLCVHVLIKIIQVLFVGLGFVVWFYYRDVFGVTASGIALLVPEIVVPTFRC
jgi:hypothetical protein